MGFYVAMGGIHDKLDGLFRIRFYGIDPRQLIGPGSTFKQRILEPEFTAQCCDSKELSTFSGEQGN